MVEFAAVTSSNIRGVGYDTATSELHVEFTNGARHKYLNVPEAEYEAFMDAGSKGRFFNENIKDAYTTQRV